MRRIKTSEIQKIKEIYLERQDYVCPLCGRKLMELCTRDICLDHDHCTGIIRGVLCRNCNSMEGKIFRAVIRTGRGGDYIGFLNRLISYLSKSKEEILIHPSYRTEEEKKRLRNLRSRRRRACKKKNSLKRR